MKAETNIYKKLLAFQKLGISVKKDGKNPHYKSQYATLNEVLDKVKKPLNDMGIVIIFTPLTTGLKTCLHDTESNTEVCSEMAYTNCDTPQKVLSCNTYYRRGSLVSLLGLEDEDDDGNVASQPVREVKKAFIQDPIEKIKNCKSVKDLTAMYNQMEITQQKAEHIIEAFKQQSTKLKAK